MDIEIWDGGLQAQEIKAIQKIELAFSDKSVAPEKNIRGGSLQEQLKNSGLCRNSMFPWKGYAGFRFVNARGKEGEFDLVIVTHCNVLIVELKDWNHQDITANGDTWYKGDKNMGRSPVSITRGKKFMLDQKLKAFKHKFTNKKYLPFVHFFVVMTGDADFSQLPEEQLAHTMSLKEFLQLANRHTFNQRFRPHPDAQVLNQDFHIFDQLFLGNATTPKPLRVDGYEARDKIFEHPKKVYREFLATSEISKNTEALLRVWNFKNVQGEKAFTPEGRAEIVSREREVLQYINHQNRDLYNHCLRSLTSFQKDEVTTEYSEVYELPPGHIRFNEFVGKFGQSFSENDRIIVAKLLIAKFSDLHEIKIAHRDIADHSLWISPSKEVALSNFISAYHRPAGTVGDYRERISVGALESKEMLGDSNLTPFQQDVHTLGLVTWHLLTGKRMSPKSMENIQEDMLSCEQWYVNVLLDAIGGGFASASVFFDALKRSEPRGEEQPTFDESELDPYRRSINHSRQYREDDDFLVETEDKEVYVTNGLLMKAWLNIGASGVDSVEGFKIMSFLKRVDKLKTVNPVYLPTIKDYGIATKSSSLYLVTDIIDGSTWRDTAFAEEEKTGAIAKLIAAVEHLHSLGLSHGDLHPTNIMVEKDTNELFLIDIPDYSAWEEEPKNHSYSPDMIDDCTSIERDNFAVMKMACELIGLVWGGESEQHPQLALAVKTELEDSLFGFKSLTRFKKAFERPAEDHTQQFIEITAGSSATSITILPDNGHLYVKVEPNNRDQSEVKVTFAGIGGNFQAFYSKTERAFSNGLSPRIRSSVSKRDVDTSHFEINTPLRIVPGPPQELSALTNLLQNDELFLRAVDLATMPDDEEHEDSLLKEVAEAFDKLENLTRVEPLKGELEISTEKLWRAILETETQSYPNVELCDSAYTPPGTQDELIIPYSSDVDALGQFDQSDRIEALLVDDEGGERFIGEVSLKKSAANEVYIVNKRLGAGLKEGDVVFLRTQQDRASFRKRKAALECLLERKGIESALIDYFSPLCENKPFEYGISVSDDDFARYDREDQHGNQISLNEQQRDAFQKLVNNGPLSLLQGPPGTGKTEFIAAFVHYLIEKQQTKRILMVSQSHEAVNTAAERIRNHCSRLNTELEVVRFSNREGAVSVGLKDVYSHAITAEKRELFKAECKYRVEALGEALGLEPAFISSVVQAELKLFRQIDKLESLLLQIGKYTEDDEDLKQIKAIAVDLDTSIRSTLKDDYEIILGEEEHVIGVKDSLISHLSNEYGVRPDEVKRVKALAKISRDMQDALSGERVNYDEFYARSRQLVTGTCVGIGQRHLGIQDNVYDWVIIDEAARSIASELAIAMQSAKRVLLVGDHLQLPPLYSDAHKGALARKLGIINTKSDLDEVLKSDFARAFNSPYGKQASAALLTQYRMAPPIGELVSQTFYGGKLKNGERLVPDVYETAPDAIRSVVTWLDTSSFGERAHHQSDRGVSIYNRCEADQIIQLLKHIAEDETFVGSLSQLTGKDEPAIGIICMYSEQKRVIQQKMNQEPWREGFKEIIKIGTVDSYQGKENRIIILSLTRSDKKRSTGFLRTPNRINVAMSRAMDRLLIVGNANMWKEKNREYPLGSVVSYMLKQGEDAGYKFINGN